MSIDCCWYQIHLLDKKYLCRHVHEQHSSNGSLSLAVSLLWSVQGVGLENTEQVLLTVEGQNTHTPVRQRSNNITEDLILKSKYTRIKSEFTRVLPETQTSHGMEIDDGGLSQSHQSILGPPADYPAPDKHMEEKGSEE